MSSLSKCFLSMEVNKCWDSLALSTDLSLAQCWSRMTWETLKHVAVEFTLQTPSFLMHSIPPWFLCSVQEPFCYVVVPLSSIKAEVWDVMIWTVLFSLRHLVLYRRTSQLGNVSTSDDILPRHLSEYLSWMNKILYVQGYFKLHSLIRKRKL